MDQVGSEKKRFEDMRQALESKNYEIVKSIGKGAFGEVVLARNSTLQSIQDLPMSTTQSKSSAKCTSKRNPSSRSISTKKST